MYVVFVLNVENNTKDESVDSNFHELSNSLPTIPGFFQFVEELQYRSKFKI